MVTPTYRSKELVRGDRLPLTRKSAYACIANGLREELVSNASFVEYFVGGARQKFVEPLIQYENGFIVSEEPSDAGFEVEDHTRRIKLFVGGLDLMMDEICRRRLDRPTRRGLQRQACESYVLHELRHVSQGMAMFAGVQEIKANAGLTVLGQIDLIADIEAARVHAAMNIGRSGNQNWNAYWWALRTNLFMMGEIAVKAFKAPSHKPHKIQRALGIAAMTSRLDRALASGVKFEPNLKLPPDAIIWPAFTDGTGITILTIWPDIGVLHSGVATDPVEFEALAADVDVRPFEDTIAKIGALLDRAEIV